VAPSPANSGGASRRFSGRYLGSHCDQEKDFVRWGHTSQAWDEHGAAASSLFRRRRRGGQPDCRRRAAAAYGPAIAQPGRAFLDHARLALAQVDAAAEAARRAAQPARKTFAIGFQTGHEMNWLPWAMHVLRDELKNIQVTISSDYSPDLAEALVRGRLDVAFLRVEPTFDLCYEVVDHEPLIVLMPSDHRLTSREAIHPREFVGEIFIGGSNKATVLRAVTEDYLRRCGLDIKLDHGVDNMAMAMSLVASTRGLALMPAYAKNLLPWSVVSRPLEGEAPTIDLAVGYSNSNTSPILGLFLSRLDQLKKKNPQPA
jgi:LysR family transcriptional regulator, hca operon transcriptional activator